MKRTRPQRLATLLALGCLLTPAPRVQGAVQEHEDTSPVAVLLGRARTLEQRGRLDLAQGDWQQVLVLHPDDAEALAGLVRAARAAGQTAEAERLLNRLRAAHPKAPELARLESQPGQGTQGAQGSAAQLAEAARLERAGDPRGALALYRRVYGVTPPPGTPALNYYQAEGALEDGRPEAIAGLRSLGDRFPADSRYPIALGRLLLRSPRTRAEGRTLLERYPNAPEAVAALHGTGGIEVAEGHAPLPVPAAHPAAQPSEVPKVGANSLVSPPVRTASVQPQPSAATPAQTVRRPEHTSAAAYSMPEAHESFATAEQQGFAALNRHQYDDANRIFREILARDANNSRAYAGLGYVQFTTGDLPAAVRSFEQAQEHGDRSLALTRALVNAEFDLEVQGAAEAQRRGDTATAETRFRSALRERPADPEALDGLGELLLAAGHFRDALPVFSTLTRVRPLSPAAWRGLVLAQAGAGDRSGVLATTAHIPEDAREPLNGDPAFTQALRNAGAAPAQLAKVEPPLPPAKPAASPTARVEPPPPSAPPPAKLPPSPAANSAPSSAASQPPVATAASPAPPRAPGAPALPPAAAAAPASEQHPRPGGRTTTRGGRRSSRPIAPALPAPVELAHVAPVPAPLTPSPAEAIATERTQQGNASLQGGDDLRAAGLFRDALAAEPAHTEAWRGLVEALHRAGRNPEAVAALAQLPDVSRLSLERDATFQGTAGEVYLAADRPNEALGALARAQEIFVSQRLEPPLALVLRLTTLLATRNDDPNLYRELMYLGSRGDMNDAQRRDVQMIWTAWAVRRARILAQAGDPRRAITILNAAAEAFAGNSGVLVAVADGYTGAGLPREAVALLKAHDLAGASPHDLEIAIAAGIAARDFKAAEGWLRQGRERYPADAGLLTSAAELAQARGHQDRALALSQQARALAPPQDPAAVLTAELREARAGVPFQPAPQGQLAVLLSPAAAPSGSASVAAGGRPFLPSSPVRLPGAEGLLSGELAPRITPEKTARAQPLQ